MSNQEILFLNPVFKQMIWGGERLATDWHYDVPGENTGECWGISAHPNGDCTIKNGAYEGKTLSELWKSKPELFGNVDCDVFPLLIKIIDAKTDLSIQVHPDDEYAAMNENGSMGKTECWYVLDAPENGKLVIGHNAKDKKELENMIRQGKWGSFIREVPVKKGDFIQIEPGTVHAIKGGIQILETQQNCDITYRVYDYDRLQNGKPRELHIEKSLDVITVPANPVEESMINISNDKTDIMNELITCKYFRVWKINVLEGIEIQQIYPFMCMTVIEGAGQINGQDIKKGDHFVIPNDLKKVSLAGNMQIIASTI